LQCIQERATNTVNGHISALRAWHAWVTKERHLEENPAKLIKLVGRQEYLQVNALLQWVQSQGKTKARERIEDFVLGQNAMLKPNKQGWE